MKSKDFNALCKDYCVHSVVAHAQPFRDRRVLKCLVVFVCRKWVGYGGAGKKYAVRLPAM